MYVQQDSHIVCKGKINQNLTIHNFSNPNVYTVLIPITWKVYKVNYTRTIESQHKNCLLYEYICV